VVWHHSLLLMNSFNKTEAAVFSCRLCFLRAFPFISLMHNDALANVLHNDSRFRAVRHVLDARHDFILTKFNYNQCICIYKI